MEQERKKNDVSKCEVHTWSCSVETVGRVGGGQWRSWPAIAESLFGHTDTSVGQVSDVVSCMPPM
jgi:hypothetical protein